MLAQSAALMPGLFTGSEWVTCGQEPAGWFAAVACGAGSYGRPDAA
jgi:hypothetical protein